jgi:DNA-binding SARP family transcriptional activator/TolB-like protein
MSAPALEVRLLGPVTVSRGGTPVALPRSRKVRALLAYLALGQGSVSRSRICDLLWDVPNDPRGELRWCLSKLRALLDDGDRRRVVTTGQELVTLDLSDCRVDAVEIDHAVKSGIEQVASTRLRELRDMFGGELLESMELDGSPEFAGWLAAQRQRYRALHVAVLQELATRSLGSEETFRCLDGWLQVAPHDQRAHEVLLEELVKCGRIRDAEDHLAATIRAFEREGLDWAPLRQAWHSARSSVAPQRAPATSGVTPSAPSAAPVEPRPGRRASVAVMPFVDELSGSGERRRVADGLTEDVITRLAKLRVVFVIARGTVFALGERGVGVQEAGRILNVDYVVSGSVRRKGSRLSVLVELAETAAARIVWTDEIEGAVDEPFTVLDSIVSRIVAAITKQIETAECNRAILKPPNSLDAWEAYHRGLWHMYKFDGPHNREAEQFFRSAIGLDPTFSRAYAGLSFTHFQNAFLELTPDREKQIDLALDMAGRSLGADDQDPGAHWAMGRALWLRGAQTESFAELERSVELSPNFALGHYTLGFVHSQTGDPSVAIEATTTSRELSPFDPLQFAMLASRAMAHVRLGQLEEAAEWAVRATARPNAHGHILAIAAECLALAGRPDEARSFVARLRERQPGYTVEEFLRAFRFAPDTEKLFLKGARAIGFDRGGTTAGRR